MSRLAVDNMGRIYSVNGDRADGLGGGTYPTCESQSDTTLGNAYLRAQARRTTDLLKAKRQNQILSYQDKVAAGKLAAQNKAIVAADNAFGMIQRDPRVKKSLIKRAVQMGCPCDKSEQMGSKMTANGEMGWRGMSRDQKIIHHELVGMGYDVSRKADASQVKQHLMKQQAENLMRIKARK